MQICNRVYKLNMFVAIHDNVTINRRGNELCKQYDFFQILSKYCICLCVCNLNDDVF